MDTATCLAEFQMLKSLSPIIVTTPRDRLIHHGQLIVKTDPSCREIDIN